MSHQNLEMHIDEALSAVPLLCLAIAQFLCNQAANHPLYNGLCAEVSRLDLARRQSVSAWLPSLSYTREGEIEVQYVNTASNGL